MSSESGTEITVEQAANHPMAVYVSIKPIKEDVSHLPIIARLIYMLIDVRELVNEHMNDPIYLRTLGKTRAKLHELNYALKIARDNRDIYIPNVGDNPRIITQREQILVELQQFENVQSDTKLATIEDWAIPYVQTTDTLTAYRFYHYKAMETYNVYFEMGVDRPKAIVVQHITPFDDYVARKVILDWCGDNLTKLEEEV